jgi:predicted MFS family arabinose efflux permease
MFAFIGTVIQTILGLILLFWFLSLIPTQEEKEKQEKEEKIKRAMERQKIWKEAKRRLAKER